MDFSTWSQYIEYLNRMGRLTGVPWVEDPIEEEKADKQMKDYNRLVEARYSRRDRSFVMTYATHDIYGNPSPR